MIRPRGDSFQVIVYAGRDPRTGKSRYLRETVRASRKVAERVERRLQGQVDDGRAHVDRPTFGELLDRWLEHARPSLAAKTFEGYERIVAKRLKPELGALRLERLRGSHLDALYADMLAAGRAPATVRQVHAVAHRACRQAMRWDWIARNPAAAATPPAVRSKPIDVPEGDEIAALFAWAAEHDRDLGTLMRLAAATGARRGELLALRWSDLDLERAELVIARALAAVKGRVVEKTTKGRRARALALDDETVSVMRVHRVREAEKALRFGRPLAGDAPLFTGQPGACWYPDTATHRFVRARQAVGASGVRFHDLRHWHVSRLLNAGVPIANVSARVGHASAKMTLDVGPRSTRARPRRSPGDRRRTRRLMEPEELRRHDARNVIVMLQDGRQLEGEMIRMTDRWVIGEISFDDWEIEEVVDVG